MDHALLQLHPQQRRIGVISSTRGGARYSKATEEDGEDSSETETESSGDTTDLVVTSSFEEVSVEAKAREQAGQSYFLTSLLWLSLAFDVILNKSKRLGLFGEESLRLVNIVPTFHLAIGFLLASGISYWLSHFMVTHKDDQRLPLVLFLFGILNLGAHTNPTKSFLGQGAAIINIHNALVSINEYSKQRKLSLLLIPNKKSKNHHNQKSTVYVTSKVAALLALASVIPLILSLPFSLLDPLQWASLARRTLLAGIAFNYNGIVASNHNWQFPTMISLSLFLGMALPMWIAMITKATPVKLTSLIPTLLYTLFAIFSGWDGIQSFRQRTQNE